MTTQDITYRIRVRITDIDDDKARLVSINEFSNSSDRLRKQWVKGVTDHIWGSQSESALQAIRPWDFILALDGSVESLPVPQIEGESSGMYPAHYCISPSSIDSLERKEQINRQERFAFGILLWEICSGRKPLEGLSDEEVQEHYSNAEFPDDIRALPPNVIIAILSFLSVEFANIINPPRCLFGRILSGAGSYIKAHPFLFAAQVTGTLVLTAAAAAPAVLGAIGFSALGPVAGSAAAGWQTSIGIVEAGSLFAWCQSAAMGGAAVGGIVATGAAGGGVAALATAATAATAGQSEPVDVDELLRKFREVYRRSA